ncbi:MAG: hypothetical protein WB689_03875 [Xanthobacteraceae bacterium]
MANDNKKAKADPAPKSEAAAKDKTTAGEAVSKTEGGEAAAAAPSNYSRGEGQKPVTAAYKENWNAIYAKKNAKKNAKKKKR